MAAHVAERHSGGGDAATGGTSGRGGEGRGEAEGEAKGRTGQQGEAVSKRVASVVKKRSVRVGKHLTSLTLENEFWEGLKDIAQERELPLNTLITDINKHRRHANLSSVLRLFVLDHYARLAAAPAKPTRRGTMSDDDDKPTSDEPSKAPIKLNVAAEGTQHKVERMAGGRFMAYWRGRVVYEYGRIKRFNSSDDALAFLARCDVAGRIVH